MIKESSVCQAKHHIQNTMVQIAVAMTNKMRDHGSNKHHNKASESHEADIPEKVRNVDHKLQGLLSTTSRPQTSGWNLEHIYRSWEKDK